MRSHLDSAFSLENLRRAWVWVHRDPNVLYKNYSRHIYRAYSLSVEPRLQDLQSRLAKETYKPQPSVKVYLPKPSGLLRPYTLLALEDHIVYQAMANIIADKLLPKVKHRYHKTVFGHLYAGETGFWFYRDWKEGYRNFSNALRRAYADGFKHAASFDLTACYDSIDHAVLKHFLAELKLDKEFCDKLCELLSNWTASSTKRPIYHGHGIPQGPVPSGLLSETVLGYFDDGLRAQARVRYFRYVDDIRLLAKSEKALRKQLVNLDLLSKDIGLFPQTSKIKVRRIKSIEDEIKSISKPPEPVTRPEDPNQERVRRRLKELSARFRIGNETRFKYVLAAAAPNAQLAERVLKLVERYPHLYLSLFGYIAKAESLSKRVSAHCLRTCKSYDLYAVFTAALIRAIGSSIHPSCKREFISYCKTRLSGSTSTYDPELRAAVVRVLLRNKALTPWQVSHNALWKQSWWVRTEVITHLEPDLLTHTVFSHVMQKLLRDKVADVSIVAAERVVTDGLPVHKPYSQVHRLAQYALKDAGIIGKIVDDSCPVSDAMSDVWGDVIKSYAWRRFFAIHYSEVLRHFIAWRGYSKTDPTAWVNLSDTINDITLDELYHHVTSLGSYTLGNIGGVLQPTGGLARNYPQFFTAVRRIHELRRKSHLSHPIEKKTGRATRYIRFKEIGPCVTALRKGFLEIGAKLLT